MTDKTEPSPAWYDIAEWYAAMLGHESSNLRRALTGRSGPWPWSKRVGDPEQVARDSVLWARRRMKDELSVLDHMLSKHGFSDDA